MASIRRDWQDFMAEAEHVLMIFAKFPATGEVKTRLIPALGPVKATRLYIELVEHTLRTAEGSGFDSVQVWLTRDEPENWHLNSWKKEYHFEYRLQQGSNLGQRMHYAFDEALSKFRIAVLIGCDCPTLNRDDLHAAREKLHNENRSVVLGPAEDGGYYLLGLNSNHRSLFEDIIWGGPDVAETTKERAGNAQFTLYELEQKWDVDTAESVKRLAGLWPGLSELGLH